ncbi:2-oxoacid dehydrogenases acyltransferase-domain-containing protein [Paraphysoderma sedebokerense]|nr:2-oxoacid dehydrogenases acyltransferase-domain-containing protein [Paraphysoderma sedebokerense]KAI9142606.1 2-oxoacid dehydrogenases acyltransferase-domain-containing protein [Paraphysoderma sedebokerense]
MPALSPTMTQGNLGKWHKKIGDELAAGDILVEIETDKAQMEFENQEEGFLAKILVQSGEKDVPVGRPIAVMVDDAADVEKFADFTPDAKPTAPKAAAPSPSTQAPASTTSTQQPTAQQSSASSSGRVIASPIARNMAAQSNVDLSSVAGSGPNSRIIKSDVEKAIKSPKPAAAPVSAPTPTSKAAPAAAPAPAAAGANFVDIPLTNMRKVIAGRLTESKSTIPHYYLTMEINMERVLKLREVLNAKANNKYKLSVNDFVIKASALALKDVPEVNSSWYNDFIRQYKTADISVAVATPSGLITPIVPAAETKGLASISSLVKTLSQKAKENKLQPNEYQGGSFTISNLGMFGISQFTAIINPPQSCILAVGGTEKKVVEKLGKEGKKEFETVNVMKVSLSCDHRVVDGAVGAQWLQRFKKYLEEPLDMLL